MATATVTGALIRDLPTIVDALQTLNEAVEHYIIRVDVHADADDEYVGTLVYNEVDGVYDLEVEA